GVGVVFGGDGCSGVLVGLYLTRRVLGELCEPHHRHQRQLHYCQWHQRCDVFFIVTNGAW
ncbi:hypothetical protein, partial [Amphritea atlantica]|uniref:hypothetical protein n=1 Tax=Amphritea atlantica TaxID=355243 RepID=UPI001C0764FB